MKSMIKSQKLLVMSVTVVLVISALAGVVVFLHSPAFRNSRFASNDHVDNITLLRKQGEVYYRRNGDPEFESVLESRKTIDEDSTVKTKDALAYVLFDEYSYHRLDSNSEIEIKDSAAGVHLFQKLGKVLHSFNHDSTVVNKEYKIDTPDVSATVRGTSFEINVKQNSDSSYSTSIAVIEGSVQAKINETGDTLTVDGGQKLTQNTDGTYETRTYDISTEFNKETLDLIDAAKKNGFTFDENALESIVDIPESPISDDPSDVRNPQNIVTKMSGDVLTPGSDLVRDLQDDKNNVPPSVVFPMPSYPIVSSNDQAPDTVVDAVNSGATSNSTTDSTANDATNTIIMDTICSITDVNSLSCITNCIAKLCIINQPQSEPEPDPQTNPNPQPQTEPQPSQPANCSTDSIIDIVQPNPDCPFNTITSTPDSTQ